MMCVCLIFFFFFKQYTAYELLISDWSSDVCSSDLDFLISPAITLAMWQVHQFPLCPFSRKVRLVLAEKGVAHELVRELPWQRRDEFVVLNPAVQTPVVVNTLNNHVLIDSGAICE